MSVSVHLKLDGVCDYEAWVERVVVVDKLCIIHCECMFIGHIVWHATMRPVWQYIIVPYVCQYVAPTSV